MMKVLILGSGGREHTLAWKIAMSPSVEKLFCAPGNAGTAQVGSNVALDVNNLDALVEFAQSEEIDLTVVGPEAPLVRGVVDRFRAEGLKIAGPDAEAARLEGSKVFTKHFLAERGIPTGGYSVFGDAEEAEGALAEGRFDFPTVVKADGLAAGKGVLLCENLEEALGAVGIIMRERQFGSAGDHVIIEEFLRGEEASFMVFTDGKNIVPMVPSQDHKAIYENDEGPNTGGMGAYSADFLLSPELREEILSTIIEPSIEGMAERGTPFRGILYAGLMLTEKGPQVLEFNVRFGDPETQAVVPRLKSDLAEIFLAMAEGDLEGVSAEWHPEPAVCVVIASGGYPGSYAKGHEITGLEMAQEKPSTVVFHAGTGREGDKIVTTGGRVLGVTSMAATLESSIMEAYEAVNKIHFKDMYYRRDIAAKGLRKSRDS